MPVYAPPPPVIPNVFNYNPQLLQNWRKGKANVISGNANTRVVFVGDSTRFGGDNAGAWITPNFTANLAQMLNGAGLNVNADGISGFSVADSGSGATGSRLSEDARITSRTGYSSSYIGSGGTLGGALAAASSTASLIYAPTSNWNTANIFYAQYSGGGTFTGTATGGTPVVKSTNGASAMETATCVAASAATNNTLTVAYTSGSNYYLCGIEPYNSAVKSVNFINAGFWGSVVAQWNPSGTNDFEPLQVLEYLAPSLTVICAGINDWIAGTSISTFTSNLQAVITAAQASGDVILMTATPNNTNLSTQPNYNNALYELAALNNCVLIDTYARWVSYTLSNALGYYVDSVHPNSLGYADQAVTLKDVMLNI